VLLLFSLLVSLLLPPNNYLHIYNNRPFFHEEHGIPIIVVKENTTVLHERMGDCCIYVNNYLEAAGVIQAMKIGVTLESLQNKVYKTEIIKDNNG